MKRIIVLFVFLSVLFRGKTQEFYGGGSLGTAFGKGWNGVKKEEHNFIPLSFFVNIPFGIQSNKNWLYEGNLTLIGNPIIGASVGKQIHFLQFLAGYNDIITGNFHLFSVYHYFTPQATMRIVIHSFYIQGTYSGKLTFLSIGLKTDTSR